jgi:hypothetical protein
MNMDKLQPEDVSGMCYMAVVLVRGFVLCEIVVTVQSHDAFGHPLLHEIAHFSS